MSFKRYLREFVRQRAKASVVRIRDTAESRDNVFSGTFVSPEGHLLTAYHTIGPRAIDPDYAAEFEVIIEFDHSIGVDAVTCRARCEVGWWDAAADIAVLELDYRPPHYLLVAPYLSPDQLSDQTLIAYGFTSSELGVPAIGQTEGKYLRALPESRRFRMRDIVTGRGHSGGPVVDLDSYAVVGTVSGYWAEELVSGDAAAVSQEWFRGRRIDLDFVELDNAWRRDAVAYLTQHDPQFEFLRSELQPPSHPAKYLRDRSDVGDALRLVSEERGAVLLHGVSGTGKTSVALELTEKLRSSAGRPVFWHDFHPETNRSAQRFIRRLGKFLLQHTGAYPVVESYPDIPTSDDDQRAVVSITSELRACNPVLVLENIHFLYRDDLRDLTELIETIVGRADPDHMTVILTSWDLIDSPSAPGTVRLSGFAESDLLPFLELHGVAVTPEMVEVVTAYRHDMTCVELIARKPESVRYIPEDIHASSEPEEFRQRWLEQYRKNLPAPARRLLLAFAVLDEPVGRDIVEATAGMRDFHLTLETLRMSPPLIEIDSPYRPNPKYTVHHNVCRAFLAISDRKQIVDAHRRAAEFHAKQGQILPAARHWSHSEDVELAVDVLYKHHGEILAAGDIKVLERMARDLKSRCKDIPVSLYEIAMVLGSCKNIRGQFSEAAKQWRVVAQDKSNALLKATALNLWGDSLRLASDYTGAMARYSEALAIAEQGTGGNFPAQEAKATLGLAKLARLTGDYAAARVRYEEAGDIFEVMGDAAGQVETEFGLGEVARLSRQLRASDNHYRRSLADARGIGSVEREAYALWGVGETLRLSGRVADAESEHLRGRELCINVGDVRSEGWALLGYGECRRQAQDFETASAAYKQAVGKFSETKSTTEVAHGQLAMAELDRAGGAVIDLEIYRDIDSVYRGRNLRHALMLCLWSKALASHSVGRFDDARVAITEAAQLAAACGLEYEADGIRAFERGEITRSSDLLVLNYP